MTSYIKGYYSKSIFQNSTGYNIGIFKVSDTNDESLADYIGRTITFTGYFHELNNIDTYIFYGKKVLHEKYGEQFQVESYDRCKPEEKDSIIEFLTSGLFKGIGEKKAKSIVDVLGKDTLKIILETPDNLILIPGISKANIETLHTKLKEYEASYETIMYLTDYGFSTKDSMIIYNTYKKNTKDIIENDIYRLIEDINDMYFKKIDMIALRNGIEKNSKIRIKSSIIYIMRELSDTIGHSYYFEEELLSYLPRVLGVVIIREEFDNSIEELILDLKVTHKEERYYLTDMYEAETFIVKRFRGLNSNKEIVDKHLDDKVKDLESFFGIRYNACQLDAIKKSYTRDFLIITGGPGTGKTTIMKGIVGLYRQMNKLTYA